MAVDTSMMKIVSDFPHRVRHVENEWIELADGTRLAARMWLPEDAEREPVPAILEFIPYRKRDFKRDRDATIHHYFAGHGYASIRVDLRGSGESDGVLEDEYLKQEQDDGLEVLRWISEQPWCDGNVGMIGISWGGFNGLQIAARQPPELKAVISLCSTDDRYTDDVHYMGGALLLDNLSWASTMFAYNSRPPDPDLVGERWRDMWLKRLAGSGLWLDPWLEHQHRDDYWKHGSVCEDYSAIECPVMAVSGWADAYSNAVFRLLANLSVPRQGLVGPWAHAYPHLGVPGPAIGFLQECLRWWERWLKGVENDVMEEPMLRAWMQESSPPQTTCLERPGRWVAEPSWPSPNIEPLSYPLAEGRLGEPGEEIAEAPLGIRSPATVGLFAGKWCAFASAPDLPADQRWEEGGSLVFDGPVLAEDLEILGAPVVELELSSDKPVAMIAARLVDVAPDGKATRVTYGLLNLTHREGHETPEPLEPGKRYRVRVQLNEIAQSFRKGHRCRLSLSTSYWPLAWLPPEPARLTVYSGLSSLTLPTRPVKPAGDENLSVAAVAEGGPPPRISTLVPGESTWVVRHDLTDDVSTLELVNDAGWYRIDEIDLGIRNYAFERYTVGGDDFDSAVGETYWEIDFRRGDWEARTVTRTMLTSTASHFRIRAELDAYEGDTRVFAKSWDRTIARRLV
jgi:putative CocE/NonD family hydrolase